MSLSLERIAYRLRRDAYRLLLKGGLGPYLHRNRPGRRMINYHGIDQLGSTQFNARFISKDSLEQQFVHFKRHFNVVDLHAFLDGASHPDKLTVCLTFDDGYRNNLTHVLPLLEKYEIPASFFITAVRAEGRQSLWPDAVDLLSGSCSQTLTIEQETFIKNAQNEYISEQGTLKQRCITEGDDFARAVEQYLSAQVSLEQFPELSEYWELLDEDEIRTLANSPWTTIGAHGVTHCSYHAIDRDQARTDMRISKQWLEKITGEEITVIAYPFGHYSRENVDDAEHIGYDKQLVLDYLHPEDKDDHRLTPRFGINPYIDWQLQLVYLLRGAY